MNYNHKSIAAFDCTSALGWILADVSIAQQSHSESGQLEEIIVTAEKRETTAEKMPISAAFNRVAVSQPRTAGIGLNYKFK